MYAIYCIYIFIITCLVIMIRIYFMIFKSKQERKRITRTNPVKTMIILGSGGHTAEMLRIIKYLNLQNYSPRIYVHADTDELSMEKARNLEQNNTDYKIIKIYRSREINQSYYTAICTTIRATLQAIPIVWAERPELILCNGPGTCVPLCIVAFMLNVFYVTQATIMCKHTFIGRSIPWNLLQENVQNCLPIEMKTYLMTILEKLNNNIKSKMDISSKWIENSLILIEACMDKTWEVLNSGYWQFVPIEYRYCYSLCTLLKALLLELQYNNETKYFKENIPLLKNIIQQIDKGILLGAPLPNMPYLLPTIASKLNNFCTMESLNTQVLQELEINPKIVYETIFPKFDKINHYDEPSMELFYKEMFMPKVPAILKGCIKHWKALEQWQNLHYLSKIAGNRTVPIEVGSRYTDEDWSQQLLKFSDFLQNYILAKDNKIGYLAQHQLFEQIPELKDDFTIPEYCNFTDNDEVEQPDINVWFGPSGTVSPLHFDPKNNFLCQVFGYKRVILYSPKDSLNLYPYDTRLLNNTAQVDPLNPNYEKWPNFNKAKGLMGYLKPGDMLYIPPQWWHHITALTPSFSVSFWWN